MFGRFTQSIWKGLKYGGLSLGVAALVGIDGVVPGFILDVLLKSGVPGVIATFVASYGTPLLAGVVAVALEQVRKHRNSIFG